MQFTPHIKMIYNFSSGPSMLPASVKEKLYQGMIDYQGSGMGIMEISHRSVAFGQVMDRCTFLIKKMLEVPDDYSILFVAGGATHQFSMIPMNLAHNGATAYYALTGLWAEKALAHAKKLCVTQIISSSKEHHYKSIPAINHDSIEDHAAYLHITSNNTIYGTQYHSFPQVSVPLVADMTSDIMSRAIPIKDFGLIYAGMQKNLGIAGMTVIIIKNSLLERTPSTLPDLWSYSCIQQHHSLYNTPATLNMYALKLMLEWLDEQGGIPAISTINDKKAKILYDAIDKSTAFRNEVAPQDRSKMNVVFTTGDTEEDLRFATLAASQGLHNIEGHRTKGGLRAAIYNAMPIEGVETLSELILSYKRK